jgi:hypothetical protein
MGMHRRAENGRAAEVRLSNISQLVGGSCDTAAASMSLLCRQTGIGRGVIQD